MEGSKLSNFKIEGPILQNGENKRIKTEIKHNCYGKAAKKNYILGLIIEYAIPSSLIFQINVCDSRL